MHFGPTYSPQRLLAPLLRVFQHALCYALGSLYVGSFYSLSSSDPTLPSTTTTNNPNFTPHLTFKGFFGRYLSCGGGYKQNRLNIEKPQMLGFTYPPQSCIPLPLQIETQLTYLLQRELRVKLNIANAGPLQLLLYFCCHLIQFRTFNHLQIAKSW